MSGDGQGLKFFDADGQEGVIVSKAVVAELLALSGAETLQGVVEYLKAHRSRLTGQLGLVFLPVTAETVTDDLQTNARQRYYPAGRPDLSCEERRLVAHFTDSAGNVRRVEACERIWSSDLQQSREPGKLRLNIDNRMRNRITEQAIRIRYGD